MTCSDRIPDAATIPADRGYILSPMRLARILGAIGRGLISAGVIVLLFVAYQLWGTGLQASAAQNSLSDDFAEATGIEETASDAESMADAARRNQEAITAAATATAQADEDESLGGGSIIDGNFDEAERQRIVAALYPDEGESLARIVIPDINVDWIVVEGVSVEDLRKGPGHYMSTPNPGQAGNAAIAGHRTTYGAPFHRVDELEPGDSIFVTTAQGAFEYRVIGYDETRRRGGDLGYFIVDPSETQVLDQGDENILTLTACHPKYSARQRIIVQAELVGEPAATIPRDQASNLGAVTLDSGASDELAAGDDTIPGENVEDEAGFGAQDPTLSDDPTMDVDGTQPADDVADAASGDTADTETAAAGVDAAAGADETSAADADTAESDDTDMTVTLVDDEAEDFGEGLNGDPTKVKPAIMWGLAGTSIWTAAWYVGKQFERKWTLYAIGLIPFALVLWSTFVNVDQALPSY